MTSRPAVAILLCTYHGHRYLAEQLDSFAAQTHRHWCVWASDDGSTDETRAILERYEKMWGPSRLSIQDGPGAGFAANFLSLSCNRSIHADYYAYSDQDDVWEAHKLERALDVLQRVPADVPALYCARTRLVDAQNREIGLSPLFTRPPSFSNALTQNIGGGNTMVYNDAAASLLREAGASLPIVSHDWWAYLAVSGCGGRIFYDPQPSLRYRQHGANLIGMDTGWHARLVRIQRLWQGRARGWNSRNIDALQELRHRLTEENRAALDCFAESRQRPLVHRLLGLKRAGVYRQTALGSLSLFAAAAMKRI
jgi:glycosyltransferase involved in cell wall biosynthesis